MQVTYYTAASIDGRVAGPDDDMSFLAASSGPSDWESFIAGIDAVVVGGNTVRWLLDAGHGWPHGDLPTWLVSSDASLVEAIGPTEAPLTRVEGDLAPVFAQVAAAGHAHAWLVGGGTVAAQALAADAIDTMVVTVLPAVLGSGPSLFAGDVGRGDGGAAWRGGFELAGCQQVGSNARLTWRRARIDGD